MMNIRLCLVLICMLAVNAWAEPSVQQAFDLVDEKIHSLMAKIEQSKASPTFTDKQKIQLVDDELGAVVDFKRIARRVMAKHFRNATKEEKYAFLAVFKSSLLSTYAKGLWEFNNYKVNLLPLNPANQTQRNTQVSFEVVTSSGQIFPVAQSLFFNKKENKWMVQNVIINGINMGLLFREQFARLVSQHNGNIGLAIEGWTSSDLPQSQDPTLEDLEDADTVVEGAE